LDDLNRSTLANRGVMESVDPFELLCEILGEHDQAYVMDLLPNGRAYRAFVIEEVRLGDNE